jgi:prefoldin subunit 5
MIETNATVAGLRKQVNCLIGKLEEIRKGKQSLSQLRTGTDSNLMEVESLEQAIEKKELLIRDYLAHPGIRPPGLDFIPV